VILKWTLSWKVRSKKAIEVLEIIQKIMEYLNFITEDMKKRDIIYDILENPLDSRSIRRRVKAGKR